MQQQTGPDGAQTIILPAVLDRAALAGMLPELRAAAARGPLRLDGTGVERIGQAGLQLILSALRSGPPTPALTGASPALRTAAALAGLDDVPGLGDEEPQA